MSSCNLHSKEFNPIFEFIQAPDTTWDESHGNPFSEFLSFYSPITVIPCLLQTNGEKTSFYLLNFPFHFCFYLILFWCFQTYHNWTFDYLSACPDVTLRLSLLYTCHSSILLSFINLLHCLYNLLKRLLSNGDKTFDTHKEKVVLSHKLNSEN